MRIGIVIDEFDRRRGGMNEWCWQFVAAVAERDHEIHIVTQRFGDGLFPANIARHLIPSTNSRSRFAQAAEQRLRELKLDVVHDMGAGWHCDILQPHGGSHLAWNGRRLAMYAPWYRALKRPVDAMLPRHRDFTRHWRRQFAQTERQDKVFVALSQTVADDFVRLHGVRVKQIAIVYNGVNCRRFSPENRPQHRADVRRRLGVDDATVALLFAAHNFRLKGLPELLRATARLAANGRPVHLIVAGGKHLAKWQRAAARLGLGRRVTFVGTVSDLAPCYAAADAFVHPTYYDPCSLVLLEAAASGLPIVTTRRHNGAAELFRDGRDILTVTDPYEADALYECVDAIFDERFRRELGSAAREVAMRHPFERNVAEINHLYDRIVGRRMAA